MATNGNVNHGPADQLGTPTSTVVDATSTGSSTSNLTKDEVGWYFVEQYYTTLSKSPEKLHLFYGKRSQFVYGLEAEVANVSVGRQAIQDKIKALDFQDCKVRVSNVDSQASFDNIVIQVIGETSNKAGEPKKFVQTFVLAQQPSGYFVLNDILRYVKEEGDDEPEVATEKESAPAKESRVIDIVTEAEPEVSKPEEPVEEDRPADLDATVIDKKLEEVGDTAKDAAPAPSEDTPSEPAIEPVAAPAKAESVAPSADPEQMAQEIAEEDAKKPETPKDPSPTPVATRVAAPVAAEPEKPKGPPKPMTWASRAAAAAGPPRPAVPLPKTATPPAQARSAAPPVSQQPAAPAAPAAAPQTTEATAAPVSSKDQGSEWQTAGAGSKRPQSISGSPAEKEGTMAYIKYVTEKVKAEDLRATLAGYGELAYFDINRQKNCAFVEFATQAGYNAAVAENPHTVNGESIVVEQRRPKANAYGGSNYNAGRGGLAGRGRGGFDGSRSASQGGPRGGFTGQSRGRGGAPRGRGASQAANA